MTSPFDEEIVGDLHRLFAVTGRKCFLIGATNGAFPDLGHHLPGEMGGLWAFPVKLADGFWFGISERGETNTNTNIATSTSVEWMHGPACRSFTMRPSEVERRFLVHVGGVSIEATQQMFVPESEPALLVDLALHNTSETAIRITLHWLVRFDIQGAWWSSWPDRPDEAQFNAEFGGIVAWDSGHSEWSGAMLSDRVPDRHDCGPSIWGPEQTGSLKGEEGARRGGILPNPDELQGAGVSGSLEYDVVLQPGERQSFDFVLAGGTSGPLFAQNKAADLLLRREELWREKMAVQDRLIAGMPSIQTPQPDLNRAFSLQNLCMDMLTLELPGVGVGATAGLPSFAWFFGCDTYYSVSGLLLCGQPGTAISTLRLLADYARKQGGRVPHEITPTGELFNPGNPVETGQFVTAIERTYRWTGDLAFLKETYEVCKSGIFDYLLGECDPGGTFLPDGPGLLELRSAGRGRKLDVAAFLYQGLQSLAYLARVLGEPAVAERCEQVREQVRRAIDEHFWSEERGEYVWRIEQDLSVSPGEPAHSYVMMETNALDGSDHRDVARLAALFAKVEGPEQTGPEGIIHPGTTDFVMPIQNAIVALAELQYGRPDKGLVYLQFMAELCDQATPWAIPEFKGEYGGDKACFIQMWSSATYNWLMVQGWFRLLPDPETQIVLVRPQLPAGWNEAHVKNLSLWARRYDLSLERKNGTIEFSAMPLDGRPGHPFCVEAEPTLPVIFV
ncbi:MAG: hypothetical protein M3014_04225 [Chloroflexota bacterium]|nr:hypothetical protein [Chloroflexota bacterium]